MTSQLALLFYWERFSVTLLDCTAVTIQFVHLLKYFEMALALWKLKEYFKNLILSFGEMKKKLPEYSYVLNALL